MRPVLWSQLPPWFIRLWFEFNCPKVQIVPIGKKIFSITIFWLVTWLTTYNMVVNYELVTITSDIQELPWANEYLQRASKQKEGKRQSIGSANSTWFCPDSKAPTLSPKTLANLHQTFWRLFKENEKEKGKKGKENRTLHEGSNLYLPIWVGSYKNQTL